MKRSPISSRLVPTRVPVRGVELPPFTGHAYPTIGLELELVLCDVATNAPVHSVRNAAGVEVPAFEAVYELLDDDVREHVAAELMAHTLEVITSVHHTVGTAIADLTRTINAVTEAAAMLGLVPISAGLHPFAMPRDNTFTPHPRLYRSVREMGQPAHDMHATGLHIHTAVPDGDIAMHATQALTALAPVFIALSASSPFANGEETGHDSIRTIRFRATPMSGLPLRARTYSGYTRQYDALRRAGIVATPKDLHTDVRPSPANGTVEARFCDAPPTRSEIAALTALCQCVVAHIAHPELVGNPLTLPPSLLSLSPLILEANIRNAARHGLSASMVIANSGDAVPVSDVINALVDALAPTAKLLGCEAELASVRTILDYGNSASRQRAVVDNGGTLDDVVEALARELRNGRPELHAPRPIAIARRSGPPPREVGP